MIAALAVIGWIAALGLSYLLVRAKDRIDAMRRYVAGAQTERDTACAERDTALVERNTAITAVRYINMTGKEVGRLASNKCKDCFGAGTLPRNGGLQLCECAKKAIKGDLKYGVSSTGEPVRLATREELIAMGHTPVEDMFRPAAAQPASVSVTPPPRLSLVGEG